MDDSRGGIGGIINKYFTVGNSNTDIIICGKLTIINTGTNTKISTKQGPSRSIPNNKSIIGATSEQLGGVRIEINPINITVRCGETCN